MTEQIKGERGRPKKLSDNFKQFIARDKKAHPDWSAAKIREKLAEALYKVKRERNVGLSDEELREKVSACLPGVSRIQKYLTEINPNLNRPSPLEQPWYLGLMSEHPKYAVPPEAIPHILKVQKWLAQRKQPELSISQALWIGRLYACTKNTEELRYVSYMYSLYQNLCTASGTTVDTTELDKVLAEGDPSGRLVWKVLEPLPGLRIYDPLKILNDSPEQVAYTVQEAAVAFEKKYKGGKQNERTNIPKAKPEVEEERVDNQG